MKASQLFFKSLKFHVDQYDHMYLFDDNLSSWQKKALLFLSYFLYFSGISFLLTIILQFIIQKKKYKNAPVVSFNFSKNHQIVYEQFKELGFSFPAYDLSFKNINYTQDPSIIKFHKIYLLLASLAKAKDFIETIQEIQQNQIYEKNYLKFFKMAGYAFIYKLLIEDLDVLIKYNDHIFNNMLLFEMCQQSNVKTIYIQHAPVSYRFPPLHHTLNVLFSEDSREKYQVLNSSIQVFDFVDVRMITSNKYLPFNQAKVNSILIAFNTLDDLEQIKRLILSLGPTYHFLLRPHPSDTRNLASFFPMKNIEWRRGTLIWEDMNHCECVISNESAIPLEAVHYKKLFYKAAMFSESLDNYSFIKKGFITKEFNEIKDLVSAIQNREVCFNKVKLNYFIGDFEHLEGKTKELQFLIKKLA